MEQGQWANFLFFCYKNAKKLLSKHETLVLLIADALMKYETLTKEQIAALVETGDINGVKEEVSENTKIVSSW